MKRRVAKAVALSLLAGAALAVSGSQLLAAPANPPSVGKTVERPPLPLPGAPRPQFSPGVGDIVRLVKANIDTEVIKAFIKRSPVDYHLTAEEIIRLKKADVPNIIIRELLLHQPAHGKPGTNPELAGPPPPVAEPAPAPQAPPPPPMPFPFQPPPIQTPLVLSFPAYGPVIAFNNSFPTFVNGQSVYAGYYIPGYGVIW